MSYQKQIADAVVTALQGVTGAPSTVEYRRSDVRLPRDALPLMIVTGGFQRPTERAFGGTIFKDYGFQVTVYRECLGDLTGGIDSNALLFQNAKQALDLPTLAGLSSFVRDVDLVEDRDWEPLELNGGIEKSAFGLLVRTNEPTNG